MSDHECDSGHFDRTVCAEPCGAMHSFCSICGKRADRCAGDEFDPWLASLPVPRWPGDRPAYLLTPTGVRPMTDADVIHHNHMTRDVKAPGKCPKCDQSRGPMTDDDQQRHDLRNQITLRLLGWQVGGSGFDWASVDAGTARDMTAAVLALVEPTLAALTGAARQAALRATTAEAEHAKTRAEVGRLQDVVRESRVLPCDGICIEYAEETCSRHGRTPADLWAKLEAAEAERGQLRDTLALVRAEHTKARATLGRVEALHVRETVGDYESAVGFCPIEGDTWPCHTIRALADTPAPSPTGPCAPDACHCEPIPQSEPHCPHVAEPGSRHEDEGCGCVEGGA